jgi:hypothetical protein
MIIDDSAPNAPPPASSGLGGSGADAAGKDSDDTLF